MDLQPLGDRAFLARFAEVADARAWASAVREAQLPGVVDVVLAFHSAAVHADPARTDLDALDARLRSIAPEAEPRAAGNLVRLPVRYDGDDLPEVAGRLGLTVAEVIAEHAGRVYDVLAIGFLPGFPYAGDLPGRLAGLPRRESPRTRVPAGSVAIAGCQTGVYPGESPGGWHLLGRTPLRIVDPARGHFPIRAGDRLRFEPIDAGQFDRWRGCVL